MKQLAKRLLATVNFLAPAQRVWRFLLAHGIGRWKPLVPEAEFYECLRNCMRQLRARNPEYEFGDYLEFGVSRGSSLAVAYHALSDEGLAEVRLIGFDSFEGLPTEAETEGWLPGLYHSTMSATRRYLARKGVDLNKVTLVKGWFKHSLTSKTRDELSIHRASLVMIDCDIYSATAAALNFCEPAIVDSAVLMFDDWGWMEARGEKGQKEAFENMLLKHPDLIAEPLPAYLPQSRAFLVRRASARWRSTA